ncbi:MAG: acyl-[acyl-carrier-protein] thioesterase [Deltaproteobacteria bacterium]|nr:acyl-[acyl-carrier-protein] thioesterase [Deltaproteobacteria bacterium]
MTGLREFPLTLPRNAFTSREVPRAGGIWRLCQDAATLASIAAGWPPSRFRVENVAFVVYKMTLLHDAESAYGEVLDARTWVSRLQRRTLCTREVRVRSRGRRIAAATQEWVHVDFETLKPRQGSAEAGLAFAEIEFEPSIAMPSFDALPGAEDDFEFDMWHTWSDPLAHANHPAYIDWCDEATSRRMLASGLDPVLLRPIAEQVTFRSAVLPGERVSVRSRRIGRIGTDAVVLEHLLETERGRAADATSVRGLAQGGGEALVAAWD